MKTDINEVKSIAHSFLELEPSTVGHFGNLFVTHPFINTSVLMLPEEKEMFNLFDQPEKYRKWKSFFHAKISNYSKVSDILNLIREPYKLTFFKYINEYLSETDFAETLVSAYILQEFVHDDANVTKTDILKWFKKAKKEHVMNKKEYQLYQSLPDYVDIFRGVGDKKYKNGFSWTLNYETALFFATRFDSNIPAVYKCTVAKEDILAYLNDRDEDEVIVNTKNLNKYEMQQITI